MTCFLIIAAAGMTMAQAEGAGMKDAAHYVELKLALIYISEPTRQY